MRKVSMHWKTGRRTHREWRRKLANPGREYETAERDTEQKRGHTLTSRSGWGQFYLRDVSNVTRRGSHLVHTSRVGIHRKFVKDIGKSINDFFELEEVYQEPVFPRS
jgi:hypothetical protein